MLPSPAGSNPNDGEDVGSWLARRDRQAERGINGNGMGTPLAVAAALLPSPDAGHGRKSTRTGPLLAGAAELLPTPQRRDGDGRGAPSPELAADRLASGRRNLDDAAVLSTPTASDGHGWGRGSDRGGGNNLRTEVRDLLPTPRATDGTKGGPNQHGSSGDLMLPSAVQPGRWGRYADAVARWERATGNPAPDPTVPGSKGQPTLNPRLPEWMMGLPPGHLAVRGVSASAQKRLAGNGVCPQQAELALRILLGLEAS